MQTNLASSSNCYSTNRPAAFRCRRQPQLTIKACPTVLWQAFVCKQLKILAIRDYVWYADYAKQI